MSETCTAINKQGSRCQAAPVQGEDRCWFHQEGAEAERERLYARMKGGERASHRIKLEDIIQLARDHEDDPKSLRSLLLGLTIATIENDVDKSLLRAVTQAIRTLESLHELEEIDARLEAVEEALS